VALHFNNAYPSTIWTMIEWHHPGCEDGGDWEKAGWWKIEPGGSAIVHGGDLDKRYWYFYAHAADGAYWAGAYEEIVPHIAFDWCSDTANTDSRTIGMRELDVGDNDDYTLTFVS
jgi:uncharacterized membrane protein